MIRLKILLLEDVVNKKLITSIYNQIVLAVSGAGTDTDSILKSISRLQNAIQFKELNKMFSNKKTGYGSFDEIINGEYEVDNYYDAAKLSNKLRIIGVNSTFDFEEQLFLGNFKSDPKIAPGETRVNQDIKRTIGLNPTTVAAWKAGLSEAVKFWKNWLNDPITKQKSKNNWSKYGDDLMTDDVWNEYLNALTNIKLIFYDSSMNFVGATAAEHDAIAFVNPSTPEYIHCNCTEIVIRDINKYEILVHEIQHILYNIKPINPEKQIKNAFVKPGTKIETDSNIKATFKTSPNDKVFKNMSSESIKLNVPIDTLVIWYNIASAHDKNDPGYVCRDTE